MPSLMRVRVRVGVRGEGEGEGEGGGVRVSGLHDHHAADVIDVQVDRVIPW